MSENAIETRGLVKTYPKGVKALDGVSFDVEAGSVFALLGPNGAGKSTTVKILTTLSRADAGEARVAGIDVRRKPDLVRRSIGCVAQKSGLDQQATGRENLRLQGHMYGLRGRALEERVSGLLERFGLAESADRVVRGYSGGMQRRLDVAIGLVHRPEVLFLDEPTTGLDPEARVGLWGEIERLIAQDGLTILLTTHYLEEADRLARRLAIIDRGVVVAAGTPEELKGEFAGDTLHIELAKAPTDGEVRRGLERVVGLRDIVLDGTAVRARADHGASAVPVALAALEAEGVGVSAVTVARPSLDDVYLRFAGRAFSEADEEVSR